MVHVKTALWYIFMFYANSYLHLKTKHDKIKNNHPSNFVIVMNVTPIENIVIISGIIIWIRIMFRSFKIFPWSRIVYVCVVRYFLYTMCVVAMAFEIA